MGRVGGGSRARMGVGTGAARCTWFACAVTVRRSSSERPGQAGVHARGWRRRAVHLSSPTRGTTRRSSPEWPRQAGVRVSGWAPPRPARGAPEFTSGTTMRRSSLSGHYAPAFACAATARPSSPDRPRPAGVQGTATRHARASYRPRHLRTHTRVTATRPAHTRVTASGPHPPVPTTNTAPRDHAPRRHPSSPHPHPTRRQHPHATVTSPCRHREGPSVSGQSVVRDRAARIHR